MGRPDYRGVIIVFLIVPLSFEVKCLAARHSASEKHFGISQQNTGDLPLSARRSRPKLSLESALKIAQSFIQKRAN
jgi:hypothetical protein